jgi:hypothetical protein
VQAVDQAGAGIRQIMVRNRRQACKQVPTLTLAPQDRRMVEMSPLLMHVAQEGHQLAPDVIHRTTRPGVLGRHIHAHIPSREVPPGRDQDVMWQKSADTQLQPDEKLQMATDAHRILDQTQ